MSGIFGALGIADTSRAYVSTIGQTAVYDAMNLVLAQHSLDLQKALASFVERKVTDHKQRYYLPGGGRLQRMNEHTTPSGVRAYGSWDVSFPLEDFGAALRWDRAALGYMTVQDLDRHLDTVMAQDVNTVRFELLYALFHKTQRAFTDPVWGSLTPECLANGDSVVYPPVMGSETEAAEDHYLGSAYAASSISDTYDPFYTIVADLEHHFGGPSQGGSKIVAFINGAQKTKVTSLSKFDDVIPRFVSPGDDKDVAVALPEPVPGTILGYHSDGCFIAQWDWIPANYILAVHLDAPRPLMMRIDPDYTGLGDGSLQLVAKERTYPLQSSVYSHRFGLAVGNRLNGVIMDLSNTDSDYDIPAAYA